MNVPESDLDRINEILEHDLYPSRSELVRVSIREFLVRELCRVQAAETGHTPARWLNLKKTMSVFTSSQENDESEFESELREISYAK